MNLPLLRFWMYKLSRASPQVVEQQALANLMVAGKMEDMKMKSIMNIIAAVLVISAAAGCQKKETYIPDSSEHKTIKLTAVIDNGMTKTSLGEGVQVGDNPISYPVKWSEGDAIAVISDGKLFKFVLDEGYENSTQATFTIDDNDVRTSEAFSFDPSYPVQAIYPFDAVNLIGGSVYYTIPATQKYVKGSFASGVMPMGAYAPDGVSVLTFTNLMGLLKLQFTGSGESVKEIKVASMTANEISGGTRVSCSSEGVYIDPYGSRAEDRYLTLGFESPVALGATPEEFLIAIPLGTHNLSLSITTTDGNIDKTYYKNTTGTTLVENTILKMPNLNLPDDVIVPTENSYIENGLYFGEGVSITMGSKTVVFAPVNCGYHPVDYPVGKLYQWGRADGSGYNDGTTYMENIIQEYTTAAYGWSGSGTASPDASKFYGGSGANNHWCKNAGGEDFWTNYSNTTTEYDPCPEGWRVSKSYNINDLLTRYEWGEHNGYYGMWASGYVNVDEAGDAKIFLPAAGMRIADGTSQKRNVEGKYWGAQDYADNQGNVKHFSKDDNSIDVVEYKNFALSVRCEKIQ